MKAAKQLAGAWPHARPPDPDGWALSLAATLAQYPLGVVEECCDPRTGLAREREFPPTVAAVVEWCDRRMKQHRGAVIWGDKVVAEKREETKFTEQHERGMLARLQELMRGIWQKAQGEQTA